jgi:hypothetical protein
MGKLEQKKHFGGRNKSHRRLLDVLPQETYAQRLGGLQSQLRALEDKVR